MKEKEQAPEKLTWTDGLDEFVDFIRILEASGRIIDTTTGKPATRLEIAAEIEKRVLVDYGRFGDYQTLELCSNGSDLPEQLAESIERIRNMSEEEFYKKFLPEIWKERWG